jgi:hypothetical protein
MGQWTTGPMGRRIAAKGEPMKLPLVVALALVTTSLAAQATVTPIGDWRAEFVGPIGPRPMMVDAITFTIKSTPNGLAGTARASNWPGDLVVSDIKFEGNRLTFTGTGSKGWTTGVAGVRTDHCCPKLKFDGTIDGDKITLMLTWGSTEFDSPSKEPLPMEAKRIK